MSSAEKANFQTLYEITQGIQQSADWKSTLSDITAKIRSLLIFDNLVIYLRRDGDLLDVIHAKAVGRGKTVAEDISWGEEIANQIIARKQNIIQEPPEEPEDERLRRPYILGIPLLMGERCYGAFLLIRFGGPAFLPNQIQMAQFLAQQITFLLDRQYYTSFERILEEQNIQLQLQKDFISTISHELRNPLGFIKGYTTTLLREDANWDETTQREFLTIIDQETDHMQILIDNLLDSSRLQVGLMKMNLQQTHLDTLINNILAREKIHHPGLDTELVVPETLQPIQADPQRLGQVIENLVSNAIKYAPGSKITVTLLQDQENSIIDVQDYGAGIPEMYLPYIFERFFRVPDQNAVIRGSGLGLFICKQIVKAHGGEIWAISPPEQGTTIRIQLPNQPGLNL
ncbi:MAG: ATP-binding protein [Anaerolineaceae bacterium]